jgi:hypothetical protein
MALTNGQIPILANVLNSGVAVLTGATTSTVGVDTFGFPAYTAGTLGGRVYSVMVSSTATASNIFTYILRNGTTVVPLGLTPVAANAGNVTGTRNIDFLDGVNIAGLPLDNTGKRYIPMMPNDVLKFSALASLAAARVFVTCHGADYQA